MVGTVNMLLTRHCATRPQGFRGIEFVAAEQNRFHAARDLRQLMDTGAVRQRRDDKRSIAMRGRGHQIAQVIGDDKAHLAVRQHRGFRPAGGSRGEEEPAWIVALDGSFRRALRVICGDERIVIVAERRRADRNRNANARRRLFRRRGMVGKISAADHGGGAARFSEISDFIRRQTEIGRHPDRAEPKAGEHALEHLIAVFRLDEDAVALAYAARGKRCAHRVHAPVELRPGPAPLAPDQSNLIGIAPRRLAQEMREIHHAL